jgi:hypothetical protein
MLVRPAFSQTPLPLSHTLSDPPFVQIVQEALSFAPPSPSGRWPSIAVLPPFHD